MSLLCSAAVKVVVLLFMYAPGLHLLRSCLLLGLTEHQIRNDNPEPSTGTILVALGDSFENALAAVMYHARSMVSAEGVLPTKTAEDVLVDGVVQPEWYERWYDGLGYCEWLDITCRMLYPEFSRNKQAHGTLLVND
jgi:hypothetical protein